MAAGTDNRKEKVRLTIIPVAVVLNGMIIMATMVETIRVWAEVILHAPVRVWIVRNADPIMETQAIRNLVVLKDGMIMEEVPFRGIITGHLSVVRYQEEITDSNGWNAGPRHNLNRRKGSWNAAAKTAEAVMAGMEEEGFKK